MVGTLSPPYAIAGLLSRPVGEVEFAVMLEIASRAA